MFDEDVASRLPAIPAAPSAHGPRKQRFGRGLFSLISGYRLVAVAALLTLSIAAWACWHWLPSIENWGAATTVPSREMRPRGDDVEVTRPVESVAPASVDEDHAQSGHLPPAEAENLPHPAATLEPAVDLSAEVRAADREADASPPAQPAEDLAERAQENDAAAAPTVAAAEQAGDVEPFDGSGLILEVEAIDSTWVQISWDDTSRFEGILAPGLIRRWVAREQFQVLSGRAHGARYWLQGNLLGNGRLGEATKILRFRADSEGVTLLGAELEPLSHMSLTSGAAEQ
jgi:hypothetical protein